MRSVTANPAGVSRSSLRPSSRSMCRSETPKLRVHPGGSGRWRSRAPRRKSCAGAGSAAHQRGGRARVVDDLAMCEGGDANERCGSKKRPGRRGRAHDVGEARRRAWGAWCGAAAAASPVCHDRAVAQAKAGCCPDAPTSRPAQGCVTVSVRHARHGSGHGTGVRVWRGPAAGCGRAAAFARGWRPAGIGSWSATAGTRPESRACGTGHRH